LPENFCSVCNVSDLEVPFYPNSSASTLKLLYMKKVLLLSAAVLLLTAGFATNNAARKPSVKASEVYVPIGNSGHVISLLDLSLIKVKDVQKISGRKMSFADRMMFKAAQRQLKRNINPDGTIDSKIFVKATRKADVTSGFHLGGFALGFFLSVIGVLIAYLIDDELKASRVKWAWIGAAISLVIYILLAI